MDRSSERDLDGGSPEVETSEELRQAREGGFASSKERLQTLFEYAPDAYYLNDLRGRFVEGNRAAEEMTGYRREELIGKSFLKLRILKPRDVPRAAAHLARCALGQSGAPEVYTIYRKDGSEVQVEIRTFPVTIESRRLVLGIARDISHRVKVERKLRKARDELTERVEERTASLARANEKLRQEIAEREALEAKVQAQREVWKSVARASIEGAPLERLCEDVLARLLAVTGFDAGSIRIADEAEELLIPTAVSGLAEELLPKVSGPVRLSAPDRSAALVGRSRTAVFAPKVSEDAALKPARERLATLGVAALMACPLVGGDDALLGVLQLAKGATVPEIPAEDRSFVKAVADMLATAAERQRAHAALAESRAHHDTVISQSAECIFLVDAETLRILEANPSMQRFLGYTEEELRAMDIYDVVDHEPGDINRNILEVFDKGRMTLGERNYRRKDGAPVPVEVSASLVRLGGRKALSIVTRDVSERRALEAQLLHAQKMEAVGSLAGEVAHDFNNMLTAVSGFGELIAMATPEDDPRRRYVDAIVESTHRSSSLTRQLLAFSRRQQLEPRVVSLNMLVGEVQHMLERLLGESVELAVELDEKIHAIRVDPGQIDQVIMNLALNARDAMPEGGTLRIQTSNVTLGPGDVEADDGLSPGEHVRLVVSDTGAGMSADTAARVFEPFFTTKPMGQGTGLGLSVVYGIVTQHGGRVRVDCEHERGTAFVVDLPAYRGGRTEGEERQVSREALAGKGERVLVVEDDDHVRTFATDALVAAGYEVVAVGDAESALEIITGDDLPAVVFSDVGLPGVSGIELHDRTREHCPGLPVLLTSGHQDDDGLSSDSERMRGAPCLRKPYRIDELLAAVKMALHGAAT